MAIQRPAAVLGLPKAMAAIRKRFQRTREIRGTYVDGAITIETRLDEVICDLLRVDPADREMLRMSILTAPILSKVDALEQFMASFGDIDAQYQSLPKRLRKMNDRRVMFAHSSAHLVGGNLTAFTFRRYRNGKLSKQEIPTKELEAWLDEQVLLYDDLDGFKRLICQKRAGTVYVHAVDQSGNEIFDVRTWPGDSVMTTDPLAPTS